MTPKPRSARKATRKDTGTGLAPIQSIERAARFMSLFSASEHELGLAEITELLGMSRPTVHRYGMSLRATGLLRYDPVRRTYSLGPRIIELGRAALAGLPILRVARAELERLSEVTNQTTVISLWDGEAPVVVEVANRTDRLVSLSVRAGSRLPTFSSAQGQLFLACSPAARAAHAAAPELNAMTEELKQIEQTGVAIATSVTPGITVLAAPILEDGEVAAAMALVCHESSVPAGRHSPEVRLLREAADRVSRLLGATASPHLGEDV